MKLRGDVCLVQDKDSKLTALADRPIWRLSRRLALRRVKERQENKVVDKPDFQGTTMIIKGNEREDRPIYIDRATEPTDGDSRRSS